MRVLLDVSAVPAQPVGAGVYAVELARGLSASAQVELVLATRKSDSGRWRTIAPNAEISAVVPDSRPTRILWEQARAAQLAKELRIDIWHGPHYTMPARLSVPSVVTIHDLTFFDHPEWHERKKVPFFRHMIRSSTKRATALVCVSEATLLRLSTLFTPKGTVTAVPLGVDHSRFSPEATIEADRLLLSRHGIREPFIGFVSTIEPRKNTPGLVRAFAQVSKTMPDLQLVIAGKTGWGLEQLRSAIETSGVATRIARVGRISDDAVAALYRRAAVIAYPSFQEGFGFPALEALACGAPLVTSTGTSLDEVVGDAAVTAAPGDDEALAAALCRALDPEMAADLRLAGPRRAEGFTWAATVEAHIEIYASAFSHESKRCAV